MCKVCLLVIFCYGSRLCSGGRGGFSQGHLPERGVIAQEFMPLGPMDCNPSDLCQQAEEKAAATCNQSDQREDTPAATCSQSGQAEDQAASTSQASSFQASSVYSITVQASFNNVDVDVGDAGLDDQDLMEQDFDKWWLQRLERLKNKNLELDAQHKQEFDEWWLQRLELSTNKDRRLQAQQGQHSDFKKAWQEQLAADRSAAQKDEEKFRLEFQEAKNKLCNELQDSMQQQFSTLQAQCSHLEVQIAEAQKRTRKLEEKLRQNRLSISALEKLSAQTKATLSEVMQRLPDVERKLQQLQPLLSAIAQRDMLEQIRAKVYHGVLREADRGLGGPYDKHVDQLTDAEVADMGLTREQVDFSKYASDATQQGGDWYAHQESADLMQSAVAEHGASPILLSLFHNLQTDYASTSI